jgi:hypothetical protein
LLPLARYTGGGAQRTTAAAVFLFARLCPCRPFGAPPPAASAKLTSTVTLGEQVPRRLMMLTSQQGMESRLLIARHPLLFLLLVCAIPCGGGSGGMCGVCGVGFLGFGFRVSGLVFRQGLPVCADAFVCACVCAGARARTRQSPSAVAGTGVALPVLTLNPKPGRHRRRGTARGCGCR